MDRTLIITVSITLLIIILIFILLTLFPSCKPHCTGAFCGPNSSDGCGGTCSCKPGGSCQANGVCCYPNCNGLFCGSDGCGGTCQCNRLPFGSCGSNGQCCYAQDCNNVYCGPNGCGGSCGCQNGATCSDPVNGGVCINNGTAGWTYNILNSTGVQRKNVSSIEECASWVPQNVALNLLNFPCKSASDCPNGDKCVNGFCNRNNVYQYWIYDPTDPSGFNCSKIRQGSGVCGLPKSGASAFDIIGNVGPDSAKCSDTCTINPICPSTGPQSCCPQNWLLQGAGCYDNNHKLQCCLNNPSLPYAECMASPQAVSCENVPNNWWKANLAEITNGQCGVNLSGPTVHVNQQTIQNNLAFSQGCSGKYAGDDCSYNDGVSSYSGICKNCLDGQLRCFPDSMCVANYGGSNQPGTCSSNNVCMN